jgi:hypothetical protein
MVGCGVSFLSPALYIMAEPAGIGLLNKKRVKNLMYADQKMCYKMVQRRQKRICRSMGVS